MGTAIWIIIAVVALAIGYAAAMSISKKNAASHANRIIEDAKREAEVIKESKILKAKEEEMKIIGDAERAANQRMQKAQANEARLKQREPPAQSAAGGAGAPQEGTRNHQEQPRQPRAGS